MIMLHNIDSQGTRGIMFSECTLENSSDKRKCVVSVPDILYGHNVLILFRKQIEFLHTHTNTHRNTATNEKSLVNARFHSGNTTRRNIIAFLVAKEKNNKNKIKKIHLHIQWHAPRILFEFSINQRHSKRYLGCRL